MKTRYFFVINPVAGKGRKSDTDKLIAEVRNAAEKHGIEYELYVTTAVGDAKRYVTEKCVGFPGDSLRFIAFGGDGTFNEVATGTLPYENACAGAYPHGTGNDFIKCFTNTTNFSDIGAQINGSEIKLDILRCNDIYCVNIINIGFDCDVAAKMSKIKTSPLVPGKAAYVIALVSQLFKKLGKKVRITADGEVIADGDILLSAFGNGRYYGGGFKALPQASPDDGIINVCTADKVKLGEFIKVVGKYKKGEHVDNGVSNVSFIHMYKCRKAVIEPDSQVGVCYDGEIKQYDKIEIEALPGALRFIVPDGSELIK